MSQPITPEKLLRCFCFDPYSYGHSSTCQITKALESMKRREGEDVDAWAKRLAEDVADATD